MNAPPGPFGPPPPPNPYAPNPYAPNPHAQAPYAQNPYAALPYGANPYAPPQAYGAFQAGAPARLDAALYSPNHVGLATFLGTPLGGAVLLALNEHRLGRTTAALTTFVAGLVATGFLLTLGFVLPEHIPTTPIGLAGIAVMVAIAKKRQGSSVQQHYAVGGKRASGWAAAGIGLLTLVAVFVPLVAVLVAVQLATGG